MIQKGLPCKSRPRDILTGPAKARSTPEHGRVASHVLGRSARKRAMKTQCCISVSCHEHCSQWPRRCRLLQCHRVTTASGHTDDLCQILHLKRRAAVFCGDITELPIIIVAEGIDCTYTVLIMLFEEITNDTKKSPLEKPP